MAKSQPTPRQVRDALLRQIAQKMAQSEAEKAAYVQRFGHRQSSFFPKRRSRMR